MSQQVTLEFMGTQQSQEAVSGIPHRPGPWQGGSRQVPLGPSSPEAQLPYGGLEDSQPPPHREPQSPHPENRLIAGAHPESARSHWDLPGCCPLHLPGLPVWSR